VKPSNDDDRRVPLNYGSRSMARDPAVIYEQQEARTCVGCVYEARVAIGHGWVSHCAIGKRYGRRCARYDERQSERE
jgi:hypothetical protein